MSSAMRPPAFSGHYAPPPERPPNPGVVETSAGRKRIAEMTPGEI
jgi:hypothetical protein